MLADACVEGSNMGGGHAAWLVWRSDCNNLIQSVVLAEWGLITANFLIYFYASNNSSPSELLKNAKVKRVLL